MAEAIKRWLADRVGAYRDLPQYLRDVKKAGTEIAYGESLLALAFGIYTYAYTVSLGSVLSFFAASFVLAGYHIWHSYYLRLLPKLEFEPAVFREIRDEAATNTGTIYSVEYLQILPRCLTESPVEDCRGRLLRVLERKGNGDEWQPTVFNEPLDLIWSLHSSDPITLEPNIPQRLNLLAVTMNDVQLQVSLKPLKATRVFSINRDFRLDVMVTGKDTQPIEISIRVRFGQQTAIRQDGRLAMPFVSGVIPEK